MHFLTLSLFFTAITHTHCSLHSLSLTVPLSTAITHTSPLHALQGAGGSDLSALLGHRRAVHRLAAYLEQRYVPIQTTPFLMLALKVREEERRWCFVVLESLIFFCSLLIFAASLHALPHAGVEVLSVV